MVKLSCRYRFTPGQDFVLEVTQAYSNFGIMRKSKWIFCSCLSHEPTILDKSPVPQYSYYSVISGLPLKTMHPFQDFLAVLPPPTLYKVETRKKFWINACNIVCGVRGGVGPVWIGKRPRKAKVSQDFCPWLSEKEVGRNKAVLRVFQACKSVFSARFLMKDRNWTNLFPAFRSFLNVF